ncbi:MAG: type II toxin-antitoxin system VapC family toxin [Candidatus Nanohalobium sp.]
MKYYIDSNIFIYAVTEEENSEVCREVLKRLEEGDFRAATSVLTLDEVAWIVKKERNSERAVDAGKRLLRMPNLQIVSTEAETGARSLQVMEETGIDPRDSLHLATAQNHGIYTIVTEDSDMRKSEEVEAITAEELLERIK